ncbi:uncharacterized protein EV420DRAFT_1768530 [Desarmillaria tabescens]|uniref:Uncharacterized protein n=1 Tax=Armillaria tabescens TaxID=1929756 RepID=A0AA39JJ11_ARMTA|nr:uncharacterized protein EV420DRAFT_1768530 [Desarmillaria tabescens]KAK0443677.1 hypothetical protein EV420DRAFT_1768530 [Desarmillaria tabescens]
MNELKCDLHAALLWVEDLRWSTRNKFLILWTEIPSWGLGPESEVIASLHLHSTANWVRGIECWNFESERYFGSESNATVVHGYSPPQTLAPNFASPMYASPNPDAYLLFLAFSKPGPLVLLISSAHAQAVLPLHLVVPLSIKLNVHAYIGLQRVINDEGLLASSFFRSFSMTGPTTSSVLQDSD